VADEPIVSGMAGRYATALFELALEEKKLDAVAADLDRFRAMLDESADLVRLVRSPVFGAEEQEKALAAVLDKAKIEGLARKFLLLVAQKRRLFAVREIIAPSVRSSPGTRVKWPPKSRSPSRSRNPISTR
jgi:F-type H+-transporting ATPase subunit delta